MQNSHRCPSCYSERVEPAQRSLARRMLNLFVPIEPLHCEACERRFNRLSPQILTPPRLLAWGTVILLGTAYALTSTDQSATTGAGQSPPSSAVSLISEVDEQRAMETAAYEDRIAMLDQKLQHKEVQLARQRDRAETAERERGEYRQTRKDLRASEEKLRETDQNLQAVTSRNSELQVELEQARDLGQRQQDQVHELEDQVKKLNQDLDRARETNPDFSGELAELKTEKTTLVASLQSAREDNEQTQLELTQLKQELTTVKDSVSALERDLNNAVTEKESIETRFKVVTSELQTKLDQSQVDLAYQQRKNAGYEQDLIDMRRELEKSSADNQVLNQEISRMGDEIGRLQQIALIQTESEKEPASSAIEGVNLALENWRRAWSAQQVEPYLSAYSLEFDPGGGATREDWRAWRTQRLDEPEFVRVTLDSVQLRLLGDNRVSASFVQRYESESYKDVADKSLVFILEDNDWKIVSERSTPHIPIESIKFN